MKLRTRLSLAFTLLSLIPTAVVGWAALRTVQRSFGTMTAQRLGEAEAAAGAALEDQRRELRLRARAFATDSPAVHRAAKDLYLGQAELPALLPLAESLMSGTGLTALYLLDAEGSVVSSGHLPGRFGYPEPELLALARAGAGAGEGTTFQIREIEVRRGGRIETVVAALVGAPVLPFPRSEPSLHVVVGRAIDDGLAERLREVSGASVRIVDAGGRTLGSALQPSEKPIGPDWLDTLVEAAGGAGGARLRSIEVRDGRGEIVEVQLRIGTALLAQARGRILLGVLVAAFLVLIASVLLGGAVSARITRPVTALAESAEALGRGEYDRPTSIDASGEVKALVEAFEAMRLEIRASHDRIAAAERVAAWQEIARRLAHEIKNPLTPISMAIETLRRAREKNHAAFDEIFDESSAAILEEVAALRRIVDEFARFARLPAPQPQPTTVRELFETTTGLFPEAPEGIVIATEIPEALPPLEIDRGQLQQVLLNLVKNALEALQGRDDGKMGGRVRLRAEAVTQGVALRVEDDGPGIPEESLADVFTPYFTTKESGTGLGLAICHRIATEHGGHLAVESEVGSGTTFVLTLPVAES
ncbi:MAG: ATP-binding protein [Deltaproteobacteria bacterium]|nr:ATP-binding protein [Deltaproteobacteria bacterium]